MASAACTARRRHRHRSRPARSRSVSARRPSKKWYRRRSHSVSARRPAAASYNRTREISARREMSDREIAAREHARRGRIARNAASAAAKKKKCKYCNQPPIAYGLCTDHLPPCSGNIQYRGDKLARQYDCPGILNPKGDHYCDDCKEARKKNHMLGRGGYRSGRKSSYQRDDNFIRSVKGNVPEGKKETREHV